MRRRQHRPRYAARPHLTTMRARPAKTKHKRSSRPPRRVSRGLVHGLIAVLVLLLLGAGAFWLIVRLHQAPEYIVKHIRVDGASLLTPDAIRRIAGLDPGRPILEYRINNARRALTDSPMIRDATVTRVLPNTIVVRVVERVPIARLRIGRTEFLVSRDGFLLTEAQAAEILPLIEGVYLKLKDPKPGMQIDDEKLSAGLQVLRLCQASSIPSLMPIELVDVHNLRNVQLRAKVSPNTPNGTVFMLGESEFGQRLARLEKALQRLAEPIDKRKVDLRVQRVAL